MYKSIQLICCKHEIGAALINKLRTKNIWGKTFKILLYYVFWTYPSTMVLFKLMSGTMIIKVAHELHGFSNLSEAERLGKFCSCSPNLRSIQNFHFTIFTS